MIVCRYVLAMQQTGDLSGVQPAFCPMTAGTGSSPSATLNWISGKKNGWMDGKQSLY